MTTDAEVKEALAGPLSIEQRDLLTAVSATLQERLEAIADLKGRLGRVTKHAKMLETEIEGLDLLLDQVRNEIQQPNGPGLAFPLVILNLLSVAVTFGVCWTLWG